MAGAECQAWCRVPGYGGVGLVGLITGVVDNTTLSHPNLDLLILYNQYYDLVVPTYLQYPYRFIILTQSYSSTLDRD